MTVKFFLGSTFFLFCFEIVLEIPFFNHFPIYGGSGGISDENFSK